MADAAVGVSTITVDSVVGINTNDIVSGNSALPNSGLVLLPAWMLVIRLLPLRDKPPQVLHHINFNYYSRLRHQY